MRRFTMLVVLCLVVVLLGCNDSTPPAVPSPQLSPQVTLPADTTKVSVALTATPAVTAAPLPTDTPAPPVTPVLLTPAPNPDGLEVLQVDYYGEDNLISFVGVVKNNSKEQFVWPLVSVVLKDAQGNEVAKGKMLLCVVLLTKA